MPSRDASPGRPARIPEGRFRAAYGSNASAQADSTRPSGHIPELPPSVSFRIDGSGARKQVFAFGDWDTRRALAHAVRDFLRTAGPTWTAKNRVGMIRTLRVFLRYLKTDPINVDRLSVVDFLSNGYADWLDEHAEWTDRTKSRRFSAVIRLLDHCMRTPHLAETLPPGFRLPRNPWSGCDAQAEPRQGLPRDRLAAIRASCAREIRRIRAKLEIGANIEADAGMSIPAANATARSLYLDPHLRIGALIKHHDGRFNYLDVRKKTPGLARSFEDHGGASDALEHLHFTTRTIVPFVLLLAIDTMFNPDTILGLEWKDIERHHPVFGHARWRIGGRKARAHRKQYRSFSSVLTDDATTVQVLLTLERFCARARRHCEPHLRDRVFLFMPRNGKFTSYEGDTAHAGSSLWERGLAAFRKDNSLPHFALSDLRKASGNLMLDIAKADIKVQQHMLQHASADTTIRIYHAEEAKAADRERVAKMVDEQERLASSRGRVDARGIDSMIVGQTAVTPGFHCANPKASPVAGQAENRLCDAFGACPACGNARVDFGNARVLRRLLQLRERILEVRYTTHPERWSGFWVRQLHELESRWIAGFAPEIRAIAENVPMPPMPRLE